MYESFFQLNEPPFNLTPDPRFAYLSPGHQEALEHMVYGVEQRKGFIAIAGEIGAGKTTLTRLFLDYLDSRALEGPQTRTALIFNTFLSEIELLRSINRELGLPADGASREALVEVLNGFLIENSAGGRNAVLIIDEAQNLSVPVLEQIRMLSNLETDTDKLIQIILVGQPELFRTLNRPDLGQLNQRVTVRYHLYPLSYEDTVRYIHHRLSVAGPQSPARFHARACRLIHRYSGGVPRRINALCDRSLLIGYARGTHDITPGFVRQAQAELTGREKQPVQMNSFRRKLADIIIPAALVLLLVILVSYLGLAGLKGAF